MTSPESSHRQRRLKTNLYSPRKARPPQGLSLDVGNNINNSTNNGPQNSIAAQNGMSQNNAAQISTEDDPEMRNVQQPTLMQPNTATPRKVHHGHYDALDMQMNDSPIRQMGQNSSASASKQVPVQSSPLLTNAKTTPRLQNLNRLSGSTIRKNGSPMITVQDDNDQLESGRRNSLQESPGIRGRGLTPKLNLQQLLKSPGKSSAGGPSRPVIEADRYIAERTGKEYAYFHMSKLDLTNKKRKAPVNGLLPKSQTKMAMPTAAQVEAHQTFTRALLTESGFDESERVHRFKVNLSPERSNRRPFTALAGTSVLEASTEQLLMRKKGVVRHISRVPYKVLDAPDLQDDFYLNLVDWSSQNVLSVGLGSCVYLWSASTSRVEKLCDLSEIPDTVPGGTNGAVSDTVTSVGWLDNGAHLAVGSNRGYVHIYDSRTLRKVRTNAGHTGRVGTIAVAGPILGSGSKDKTILCRDLRSPLTYITKLAGHRQEVCGLKWSAEGHMGLLASGGNDNKLCIWEGRGGTGGGGGERSAAIARNSERLNNDGAGAFPQQQQNGSALSLTAEEATSQNNHLRYKFADHTAAVKAIAWSPNTPSLLASGGGTADRKIRFWNTTNGSMLNCHDTGSQVCNLVFSKNSGELVSTHGYSQNQVIVWRYPGMQQLAQLTGHTYRVLYLAMSPDGQTIVTGAGDETLRFWNVFSKSQQGSGSRDSAGHRGSMSSGAAARSINRTTGGGGGGGTGSGGDGSGINNGNHGNGEPAQFGFSNSATTPRRGGNGSIGMGGTLMSPLGSDSDLQLR